MDEDGEPEPLTSAHQRNSALMCNTNPLLNALNLDTGQCRDKSIKAAVLKEE